MPESKPRNKASGSHPGSQASKREDKKAAVSVPKPQTGNPRWLVPLFLGLMIAGLAWIVTYYLSGSNSLPIPAIHAWNLAVGFALILSGFVLTTRWK